MRTSLFCYLYVNTSLCSCIHYNVLVQYAYLVQYLFNIGLMPLLFSWWESLRFKMNRIQSFMSMHFIAVQNYIEVHRSQKQKERLKRETTRKEESQKLHMNHKNYEANLIKDSLNRLVFANGGRSTWPARVTRRWRSSNNSRRGWSFLNRTALNSK